MGSCGSKEPPREPLTAPEPAVDSGAKPQSAQLDRELLGKAQLEAGGAEAGSNPQPASRRPAASQANGKVAGWITQIEPPPNGLFPTPLGWLDVEQFDSGLDQELVDLERDYHKKSFSEFLRFLHRDYEGYSTSTLYGAVPVCRAIRTTAERHILDGGLARCEELLRAYWQTVNIAAHAKRTADACREIVNGSGTKASRNNVRLPCDLFEKGGPEIRAFLEQVLPNLREDSGTDSSPIDRRRSSGSNLAPQSRDASARRASMGRASMGEVGEGEELPWSSGARAGSPAAIVSHSTQ